MAKDKKKSVWKAPAISAAQFYTALHRGDIGYSEDAILRAVAANGILSENAIGTICSLKSVPGWQDDLLGSRLEALVESGFLRQAQLRSESYELQNHYCLTELGKKCLNRCHIWTMPVSEELLQERRSVEHLAVEVPFYRAARDILSGKCSIWRDAEQMPCIRLALGMFGGLEILYIAAEDTVSLEERIAERLQCQRGWVGNWRTLLVFSSMLQMRKKTEELLQHLALDQLSYLLFSYSYAAIDRPEDQFYVIDRTEEGLQMKRYHLLQLRTKYNKIQREESSEKWDK